MLGSSFIDTYTCAHPSTAVHGLGVGAFPPESQTLRQPQQDLSGKSRVPGGIPLISVQVILAQPTLKATAGLCHVFPGTPQRKEKGPGRPSQCPETCACVSMGLG